MVGAGFGMGPRRTLAGAWHVLRANQVWAPYPDNDPDAAREQMRRFYALVASQGYPLLDPVRAAELEVSGGGCTGRTSIPRISPRTI